jgi:hypothetical protein
VIDAAAADAGNVLLLLNSQSNSAALVQGGAGACSMAVARGLQCAFAVDISNTTYNPGTFFQAGVSTMATQLAQTEAALRVTPGIGSAFVGSSVFCFEAMAPLVNVTLPTQPATPPPIATATPATATVVPRAALARRRASFKRMPDLVPTPTPTLTPPMTRTTTTSSSSSTALVPTPTPTATAAAAPTPTATAASVPLVVNVTVQLFDATLVYRGASNWTAVWTGLARLRALYGLGTTTLQLDVTTAILDDPAGVQAFVNAAAARGYSVHLLLTNQNWALASFHSRVRTYTRTHAQAYTHTHIHTYIQTDRQTDTRNIARVH